MIRIKLSRDEILIEGPKPESKAVPNTRKNTYIDQHTPYGDGILLKKVGAYNKIVQHVRKSISRDRTEMRFYFK